MDDGRSIVHGTAIAIGDRAVLLRGPSGSGKSDLALRCLAQHWHIQGRLVTAALIADDQVVTTRSGDAIHVSAPEAISGLIEVRGVGIIPWERIATARLALVADLVPPASVERLPERSFIALAGVQVPRISISPFEPSAPVKLLVALTATSRG